MMDITKRLLVLALFLPISVTAEVPGELVRMTTDSDKQTEPAVIRSATSTGLDVTTTAFMTWLPSGSTVIQTIAKWSTGQSPTQEPDRAGLSD